MKKVISLIATAVLPISAIALVVLAASEHPIIYGGLALAVMYGAWKTITTLNDIKEEEA